MLLSGSCTLFYALAKQTEAQEGVIILLVFPFSLFPFPMGPARRNEPAWAPGMESSGCPLKGQSYL